MTTVTISNDEGQLTITVDGGEAQPLDGVEQACQAVEEVFGAQEQESPQEDAGEPMEAQQGFEQGFGNVRGGGLNGMQG